MALTMPSHTSTDVSVGLGKQSEDEFLHVNNLLEEAMRSLDDTPNDFRLILAPPWILLQNCPSLQTKTMRYGTRFSGI